jgi:hypothetical protein
MIYTLIYTHIYTLEQAPPLLDFFRRPPPNGERGGEFPGEQGGEEEARETSSKARCLPPQGVQTLQAEKTSIMQEEC